MRRGGGAVGAGNGQANTDGSGVTSGCPCVAPFHASQTVGRLSVPRYGSVRLGRALRTPPRGCPLLRPRLSSPRAAPPGGAMAARRRAAATRHA
jgi:hypothetical protein